MPEITTAGIFRRKNLFLIAKRLCGGSMSGRWEFPGGKTEPEETPEQALEREILEEFGAKITVGKFITSAGFSNNGKEYSVLAFEAVLKTPIRELREHEQVLWLPLEEIGKLNLADSDRQIYKELERLGNTLEGEAGD
jgi:8-oxo-dGTP diphosphatase